MYKYRCETCGVEHDSNIMLNTNEGLVCYDCASRESKKTIFSNKEDDREIANKIKKANVLNPDIEKIYNEFSVGDFCFCVDPKHFGECEVIDKRNDCGDFGMQLKLGDRFFDLWNNELLSIWFDSNNPVIKKENKEDYYKGNSVREYADLHDLSRWAFNVLKYITRAGRKPGEDALKDLEKAKDYLNYEIERINKKA